MGISRKPFYPVWRTRGAFMRSRFLEFVRTLGPQEELDVRALMVLSRRAATMRTETAVEAWYQLGEQRILPAIRRLKGIEREVSEGQYYLSAETVAFGTAEGRKALDVAIRAIRTNPDIASLAKALNDTRRVHARALGWVEEFGLDSKISLNPPAFIDTLPTFTARVPLHSESLLPVTSYIINNHEAIYMNRRSSRSSYDGNLSWVQGNLFQPYVLRSRVFRDTSRELMAALSTETSRLGGAWRPEELKGGIYLFRDGGWKESVDWAAVGTNSATKQAYFRGALQIKAAKTSEAAEQTLLDVVYREPDAMDPYAPDRSYWPTMLRIVTRGGKEERVYQLIQPPRGPTKRYVVNTAGGNMPAKDLRQLEATGIKIHELQLELSAEGMRAVADSYILATLKVLFQMLEKDFAPGKLPQR